MELTDVQLPLVAFRWTFVFEADGSVLTSESTLRFRSDTQVLKSLSDAGFIIREIRDAPDRPRQELVFIALRPEDGEPHRHDGLRGLDANLRRALHLPADRCAEEEGMRQGAKRRLKRASQPPSDSPTT